MAGFQSTVSRQLARGGVLVVDADAIAKQGLQPHSWAWRRLKRRLPLQLWQRLVDDDGRVRRAELRQAMLQDCRVRRILNHATHLPIAVEVLKQLLIVLDSLERDVALATRSEKRVPFPSVTWSRTCKDLYPVTVAHLLSQPWPNPTLLQNASFASSA